MEKYEIKFSLKNIPYARDNDYREMLIHKTERFIKRLRWKVFWHKNKDVKRDEQKETFNFKSFKTPPKDSEQEKFEIDLMRMAMNVQFEKNPKKHRLGEQMKDVIRNNKKDKRILVSSDKTNNNYWMDQEEYSKSLDNAITKEYKKGKEEELNKVNEEAAIIAKYYEVEERAKPYGKSSAYVTIKDHKQDFISNRPVRLINPSKSEIGKISKIILDRINSNIRQNLKLPQWRSTNDAISWFKDLKDKSERKFVKFDIVSFYPSITRKVLMKAINWAKEFTEIKDIEIAAILNARNTFLFKNNQSWVKKTGNEEENFDVSMGSMDSSECSDLVGLYILSELSKFIDKDSFGLYKDDGIIAIKGSGPEIERIKKQIIVVFKNNDMKIEIGCTCMRTDFLDLQIDLERNVYEPYSKPNHNIRYIDANSNHPPIVKKNLPSMIVKRIFQSFM